MSSNSKDKALLILDLDETLIQSYSKELGRPCDFRIFEFFVYKRPHLDYFLTEAFSNYKVAVWSTGSDDYVDLLAKEILPEGFQFEFVWGRNCCTAGRMSAEDVDFGYTDPGRVDYIKPIKKLRNKGYNRERILIVDDSPHKVSNNFGNAIYVSEYTGNASDDELLRLFEYLKRIADVPNYRLIEKRGWRESL
jgi:carboxy-terminal domain RNA polymerase II polypeptide A small phosphatase